jgi:hypothetical protein
MKPASLRRALAREAAAQRNIKLAREAEERARVAEARKRVPEEHVDAFDALVEEGAMSAEALGIGALRALRKLGFVVLGGDGLWRLSLISAAESPPECQKTGIHASVLVALDGQSLTTRQIARVAGISMAQSVTAVGLLHARGAVESLTRADEPGRPFLWSVAKRRGKAE